MGRINGQVKDQEELAKQVLWWITCAQRPLTTSELQHALGVEIGEPQLDKDNLPEVEDMVSACAGLVTIDEESGIIRLVHYTTQEYLGRMQSYWFPNAEINITKICVSYLLFDEFKTGICQDDEKLKQRLQSNKLYDYAAHNWGHHARKASMLTPEVTSFLETKAQAEAASQALMAEKGWLGHVDSRDFPKQMTGLHLAAYFGVKDAVGYLLRSNIPEPKDSYSRTPLLYAAKNGHEAVVQFLLATRKVDVDLKDNRGRTPLSYAADNGREAIVQLILATRQVDVDLKDNRDRTPLSYAADNGHEAIVQLLLATSQVDIDSKDKMYQTPLLHAAKNGHEGVLKLIREYTG
jgi:hypothetical protein